MNVLNYIDKYGNMSFEEKGLNEVDKLIFGLLSYVEYNGIVSNNSQGKKTIREVGKEFFNKYSKKELKKNIMGIRSSIQLFKKIMDTNRYGDLLLFNDIYIADMDQQFSSICIELNPNLVYVSFEGTDELLSGWEEDCRMAYKFPVKAQRQAINYLNKHFTLGNQKIIVGGHSKGGNLALVASMYANHFVRNKIVEVYSFDGPGLRKKQIDSYRYNRIKDKLIRVVPSNSIVGMLLRNDGNYKVIKTNQIGGLSHNALTWQLDDDRFKDAILSNSSIIFYRGLIRWLDKYDDSKREKFVIEIFKIFRKLDITSLIDIMDNYMLLVKIVKETSNLDPIVKNMTKELFNIIVKSRKELLQD